MRNLITAVTLLLSHLAYGQEQLDTAVSTNGGELHHAPTLILKVNSTNYPLDSLSIRKINPKWIKRVEILKENEDKYIFGNKSSVVFIYPKRKFYKQIVSTLMDTAKN